MNAGPRVSAIIPTLNGAATLPALLQALGRTSARLSLEIVAIDSGSRDGTVELLRGAGATVLDLGGRPFGHATARNRAASHARGGILLFLTQDVEPVGDAWIDPLLLALEDPGVAGAFGRQIPRDASPEEAFLGITNYGERPRRLTAAALAAPFGPGATFFSNAFGAMRRTIWERFPFPDVVMSEDQAWGRAVLGAGLSVHYVPEAAVYHGHRLSLLRAFRRNFDSGSSLRQLGLSGGMWSSGLAHLARELRWIAREHGAWRVPHALLYEGVRMTGFQCGRLEPLLPLALARRLGEAPRAVKVSGFLPWLREVVRQLSPAVRAETAYTLGRERLIREASQKALAGETWMDEARPFGRGFDERVVEYPWVYAHLGGVVRLLDVGSALNHAEHIAFIAAGGASIVFLNPYRDDGFRSVLPAARYARADARAPGLRAGSFERVTCISTLEHMGCDNTLYGGPPRSAADEPARARVAAMRGMRELLAPGGRLLLTVPYGRAEDHGWFVQLDAAMLADAVASFAPGAVSATYFLYEPDGWRAVAPERCAAARYGQRTRGATAVACVELRV